MAPVTATDGPEDLLAMKFTAPSIEATTDSGASSDDGDFHDDWSSESASAHHVFQNESLAGWREIAVRLGSRFKDFVEEELEDHEVASGDWVWKERGLMLLEHHSVLGSNDWRSCAAFNSWKVDVGQGAQDKSEMLGVTPDDQSIWGGIDRRMGGRVVGENEAMALMRPQALPSEFGTIPGDAGQASNWRVVGQRLAGLFAEVLHRWPPSDY
jgi:hypothetical protein